MEAVFRTQMPKWLGCWKSIYHCYITMNVKAFLPFQATNLLDKNILYINLTIFDDFYTPSHKLSYATSSYPLAVEQGQLTVCKYNTL